ncbi:hypothetical protein pb186bvf_018999 [Paramecium bursaria]
MLTSIHNKSRSSTIFLTKTQLVKVKDDIFIKKDRKKAISERISPRQKQLKEDFAMFQFLKTERDNLFQTQQVKQNPKKITSPNNQKKKSFIEMKMERYQQQVQETFNKRKQDLLLKQKLNLEQDLQDLKKITQKGQIEFFNKVGLYSKYYSQELINPQSYRQEDLNLPIYRQSNIENNNSFRKILIKPQINARMNESPEIKVYDVKIIQNDTQNLEQQRQQIQRSVHHKEDPFFEYIKENDILRVKSLLSIDQSYVNLRTKLNETPLHIAAKKNSIEIVEVLLNYNADERAKDMFGRTPRQSAQLAKSFDVLKLLSH